MKSINYKYLIISLFCLILINSFHLLTYGQDFLPFVQIDTIKIRNSPHSKILIMNLDFHEIKSNDEYPKFITTIKIYDYLSDSLVQTINDSLIQGGYAGGALYKDINLDGYLDIDINEGSQNLIDFNSFWLYDSTKNQFYYSPQFSQLKDFKIDTIKKEITSVEQGLGGRTAYSEKYKIKDGRLSLIETENSHNYDYERKEIVNGILRTVESSKEGSGLVVINGDSVSIMVIKQYKLIYDTLLITEKDWFYGSGDKDSINIEVSDIYNCEDIGDCIKYLQKEVYSYKLDNDGSVIQDNKKYKVINNKWKLVKDFN